MVIQKVFNLISNSKKKSFKIQYSVINRVKAKSTLFGRKKVEELKKKVQKNR